MRKVYLNAMTAIRLAVTATVFAIVILCLASFFQVVAQNTKESPVYSKWNVFYLMVENDDIVSQKGTS